ncbi:MAG: 2-succinyl-5-enolpyruvyl-6-hydroxy-3-cyclohexene-1-carboxylic-acid synthase, partial [Candidatus Latescibacteria bacterium]|nr:2-succinyl-5-enolpyruvyl-6-hydroxy-3-cyclohexene-1-carboxylic-acid synthase [Candidatus Latescibacterota bacterium]
MPSRVAEDATPPAREAPPLAASGALNVAWADRFVAALHAAGVRHVVISSGSRSAPLALAFDRSPITTHVSLDERSAGFFALGLAKASRRPAALVSTSGTAAANLFPAIVEARHARVPLIVATADRPPELRDTGAAQTIDQIKMFGGAVRWFVEVGTPDGSPPMLEYVASLGARAASESTRAPAGPVHLNFAFREPLVPEPDALPPLPEPPAWSGAAPEPSPPARGAIDALAKAIRSRPRGLIVCGPDDAPTPFSDSVARLGERCGYPVLADPASQVRFGAREGSAILGAYDAFLRSSAFATRHAPEIVIQFGSTPTSKAFHLYEALHPSALHILVDPAGGWRSPLRRAREVVAADPTLAAEAITDALAGGAGPQAEPRTAWLESFRVAETKSREIIARHLAGPRAFTEGGVFPDLLETLPEGATLYVGNSMAIRDLDAFVPAHPRRVRVLANRGANGIDGVVSSALGASAASATPLL